MSWALTASATSTDDVVVGAAIDASLASLKKSYEESDYALSAESEAQIGVAKDVAIAIAKSGKIGTGVGVQIQISGHANVDHKPISGYPADSITVTVTENSVATAAS